MTTVNKAQDRGHSERRGCARGVGARRGRSVATLTNPHTDEINENEVFDSNQPTSSGVSRTLVSPDDTAQTVIETGSTSGRYAKYFYFYLMPKYF